MPEHVLLSIIGILGLAVLTLSGLWVKDQNSHRQWASQKITEHEKDIALIKADHAEIKDDIREIKDTLKEHLATEVKFQNALIARFNLKVE